MIMRGALAPSLPCRARRGMAGLSAVALAGCVAGAPSAPAARPGMEKVDLGGETLTVAIEAEAPGAMLTADGARPVAGNTLRVRAEGRALAMDEGALAKRAARAACRQAGGRFAEGALGRFDRAGGWIFAGGCA